MMKDDSRVGHGEQSLQPPEHPVHPPVLGQLDRRARQIAAMLLELGLELGEERERVGRRAREAREHAIVVDLPTFRAPAFTIVWPIDTWPSPASATCPRWRTQATVVA